jgi:signal peptidase
MLVCTAVLSFLGLAVGPHVLDYRTMTMLTGSMAPNIEPGDVVVSTPLDVQDVQVGMVITYHIPIDDHRVVTHRVIEVDHTADGTVSVRTQGDANDAPDPWTAVLTGDTAYQMRAVVPEIGTVITALRDPVVNKTLVYGAPALLAGWMLLSIWRPARDEDDEADAGGPTRA